MSGRKLKLRAGSAAAAAATGDEAAQAAPRSSFSLAPQAAAAPAVTPRSSVSASYMAALAKSSKAAEPVQPPLLPSPAPLVPAPAPTAASSLPAEVAAAPLPAPEPAPPLPAVAVPTAAPPLPLPAVLAAEAAPTAASLSPAPSTASLGAEPPSTAASLSISAGNLMSIAVANFGHQRTESAGDASPHREGDSATPGKGGAAFDDSFMFDVEAAMGGSSGESAAAEAAAVATPASAQPAAGGSAGKGNPFAEAAGTGRPAGPAESVSVRNPLAVKSLHPSSSASTAAAKAAPAAAAAAASPSAQASPSSWMGMGWGAKKLRAGSAAAAAAASAATAAAPAPSSSSYSASGDSELRRPSMRRSSSSDGFTFDDVITSQAGTGSGRSSPTGAASTPPSASDLHITTLTSSRRRRRRKPASAALDPALANRLRSYAVGVALVCLCVGGLCLAALLAPWFTHIAPGTARGVSQCLINYGLTSTGWTGPNSACPPEVTDAYSPWLAKANIQSLDQLNLLPAAAGCFGASICLAAAAALSACGLAWRAHAAREGAALVERRLPTALTAFWLACAITALCGAGALLGNYRYEDLINSGLIPVDGFGVGRACGDAAVVVGLLGALLAGLAKGKLRKAAVAKKLAMAEAAGDAEAAGEEEEALELEAWQPVVEIMLLGGVLHPTCKCC